jgi:hypothetical protein
VLKLRELDPQLVVTGSKDAYPADQVFTASEARPEAVNHHADAFVYAGHMLHWQLHHRATAEVEPSA